MLFDKQQKTVVLQNKIEVKTKAKYFDKIWQSEVEWYEIVSRKSILVNSEEIKSYWSQHHPSYAVDGFDPSSKSETH